MMPVSARRIFHRGRAWSAGAACLLLPLSAALAQQPAVNWPLPAVPAGANPAAFPMPKNDWMTHFQRSVDRTKRGNVDLVFDGDSITDFWMSTGKGVWTKYYGKLNAVDYGISGDRTENLLWRLDHGQVAGMHPKLVVLMIGTNNTGDCSDVQIAEGIAAVVRGYRQSCPDTVILLQAVLPRAEKPTDPTREKIKRINQLLPKLGDGKKVLYVNFGDRFVRPDGTINRDLLPDTLHPNAKGYEVWAEEIRPVIEKVLGPAPAVQ